MPYGLQLQAAMDPGAEGKLLFLYHLASHLKKPVHEIINWPAEELQGWSAYFKKLEEQNERR